MPSLNLAENLTIFYRDPHPQNLDPVLLLHGLGADGSSWRLQIDALGSAGFRPIAPDARGFGRSTYPNEHHRISTMAADLSGLLEHLDRGSADVIGISLGGMVGLQLALDFPACVRRLILINTAAWLFPDDLKTFLYYAVRLLFVMTVGIERQAPLVTNRIFPHADQEMFRQTLLNQILAADPRAYRRSMLALSRFDVRHRLASLTTPTLVITGEMDTTILPRRQFQLAAGITHCTQVLIPGAGHAVIVERPAKVNALILGFLQNDPAQH